MNKIVTFGEVIMRLSPSENRKIQQANRLDIFFGGTEMNVAASLSNFGLEVKHVSNLSDDIVGKAAIATLRSYGIDTSGINMVKEPLGLYFLETGTAMRSSQISYNRLNGAFSSIHPDSVNWYKILEDCKYFHWTGITPGISEGAYLTLKKGLEIATEKGFEITADPAYRSNLWRYGRKGKEVLHELVSLSTIFIGGVNEINEILSTNFHNDKDGFIEASKALMNEFTSVNIIFDKVRDSKSASSQNIFSQAWTGESYLSTAVLEIDNIRDRVGTGDAFAAGILYGLQNFNLQETLDFANAACALKHTIVGDVNLVSVGEVQKVAVGEISGRIIR